VAVKAWSLPHTPDGQPDLQGTWTNASRVPLQRPEQLGTKEFYTQQEAAENEKKGARGDRPTYSEVQYDLSQYGLATGQERVAPSRRTSIIVGPEGRIPPMTSEAQQRVAATVERAKGHDFDGPENRPLQERCILAPDAGPPMLPAGYNSNLQIVQGPDYVAILQEMIHDTRVVSLNGHPHLPTNIRQLRGDPRGHWEGEPLVVDNTNFTGQTPFRSRGVADLDRHFGFPVTNLHVVERFTRKDENTILYEFTVDDPSTWTKSWSGQVTLAKITSPIYEYACQEANYGMPDILSGARAEEQRRTEAASAKVSK
jgi:hypothetical protein